jgi:hypothetical protein
MLRAFRTAIGVNADSESGSTHEDGAMATSEAVLWRDGEGAIYAGSVELGRHELTLRGSSHGRHPSSKTIQYGELAGLTLTHAPAKCLYGRQTLVLELREGGAVNVASLNGVELLREMRDRISAAVPYLPAD